MADERDHEPSKTNNPLLLREFLTQADIDRERQQRQLEWERVRRATDPIEPPPEVFDARPLWAKLQEQQERKRISFEEQYSQRNCIKGLDEDEFHFLSDVDKMKAQQEKQIKHEEEEVLNEFRQKRVSVKNSSLSASAPDSLSDLGFVNFKCGSVRSQEVGSGQLTLLKKAVKRKLEEDVDDHDRKKQAIGESVICKTDQCQTENVGSCVSLMMSAPSVSNSNTDSSDVEEEQSNRRLLKYLIAARRSFTSKKRRKAKR